MVYLSKCVIFEWKFDRTDLKCKSIMSGSPSASSCSAFFCRYGERDGMENWELSVDLALEELENLSSF